MKDSLPMMALEVALGILLDMQWDPITHRGRFTFKLKERLINRGGLFFHLGFAAGRSVKKDCNTLGYVEVDREEFFLHWKRLGGDGHPEGEEIWKMAERVDFGDY